MVSREDSTGGQARLERGRDLGMVLGARKGLLRSSLRVALSAGFSLNIILMKSLAGWVTALAAGKE